MGNGVAPGKIGLILHSIHGFKNLANDYFRRFPWNEQTPQMSGETDHAGDGKIAPARFGSGLEPTAGVSSRTREAGGAHALSQLTGVRALAATMVYLHHYTPPRAIVGSFLYSFFREMHSGVTIFFVLSGFLIYYRHSGAEALRRIPLIRYCFHRFARIYPMYFLVVIGNAVWTLIYFRHEQLPAGQVSALFLLQLTFLKGFSNQYKFIGVGQGWTLTVEVVFYILFPLLLVLVRRLGFLATLVLIYAAGMLLSGLGSIVHYHEYFTPSQFMIIYTFFGRAGDFFAGMMLADYVMRTNAIGKGSARQAGPGRKAPVYTLAGGVGIACCLAALGMLEPSDTMDGVLNPWGCAIYILILPPAVCALFYGLIVERTWFARLLGCRLLVIMGASSYCFYLIHMGGPHYMLNDWVRACGIFPSYVALFLISFVLWKYVEEPLRVLILSRAPSRPHPRQVSLPA
jgi:peptidoglycan/LPS O-acetylase OafA/YrhL